MTYRPHGHTPSDAEIAAHGYRAFGPRRPPFVPTKEDFARAAGDTATGDADELAAVGEEVAGWWPQLQWVWPWGYLTDDDY